MTSTHKASLQDLIKKINSGQLDSAPSEITFDWKNAGEAELQMLLELLRYRSLGHDLEPAEKSDTTSPKDMGAMFDRVQGSIFRGEFDETLVLLEQVFNISGLKPTCFAKALQFKSQASMELGLLESVPDCLERSLNLAKTLGNPIGKINTHLLYARYAALTNGPVGARAHLAEAIKEIRTGHANLVWFQRYLRTASHVEFLDRSPRSLGLALSGVHSALLLEDPLSVAKGLMDLLYMERAFGLNHFASQTDLKGYISAQAFGTRSDLNLWMDVYSGERRESLPLTLQNFLQVKGEQTLSHLDLPPWQAPVYWIYDSAQHTLIDMKHWIYKKLVPASPLERLLLILHASTAPIGVKEAFEKVWELRFDPSRHMNTLQVTLSRFNGLCPQVKIKRENNALSMGTRGIII